MLASSSALALHQVARLARGLAGPGGGQALLDDPPAVARVLLEVLRQSLGDDDWTTWPLTSALPSLPLVWPSNCGSGSLTLIDRGQALAHVVAGEVGVRAP